MTEETIKFIENWESKLAESKDDNLGADFDIFNTLYTINNRLQREVFEELKSKGSLPKQRYSDYEKATSILIEYLTTKIIIDKLVAEDRIEQASQISTLIKNKVFHINLADGIPQIDADEQLADNLISTDVDIKAKAILSVIYNVRCNMVHGHKDFENYQSLLVKPLSSILSIINELLKNKLT
jgi:hypothetical protein|tara:strand:+ start:64 stop:612 length:549 start_codon:yes stop_codon:yes gene_type:complete